VRILILYTLKTCLDIKIPRKTNERTQLIYLPLNLMISRFTPVFKLTIQIWNYWTNTDVLSGYYVVSFNNVSELTRYYYQA